MLRLSDAELLDLWTQGAGRHALDRALLLYATARQEATLAELADAPLPERDRALLDLRCANFGERLPAFVDCPACATRLEFMLDAQALRESSGGAVPDLDGRPLRAPSSRDLALALQQADPDAGRRLLASRCLVEHGALDVGPSAREGSSAASGIDTDATLDAAAVDRIEALLAEADAAGELLLDLGCEACGHRWQAAFDIAQYLWEEIDAGARRLIGEVDALARAYGWSEPEVLALGPVRRAVYLDRVLA